MVHVTRRIDTNYSTATLLLLKHSSYSKMSVKRPLARQDKTRQESLTINYNSLARQDKNVYSQINHTLQW